MDKYIVVKVRKNVDGKRDYLQVDSWSCGSPIIVNQEAADKTIAELNDKASESRGFEEIKNAFAIYVGNLSFAETTTLTRSIQSAQLQKRSA